MRRLVCIALFVCALLVLIPACTTTQASNAGLTIMPLGDSITSGAVDIGGYRGPLWNSLVSEGATVDYVGSQNSGPTNFDTDNEGHPGWRIDQISASIIGWLNTYHPQIILLHIGTNDILQSYNVASMPTRLSSLIDQITSTDPTATLIVAQITPLANSTQNAEVVTYNNTIPGIVQARSSQGKHVQYVDMYDAVPVSDLADGIHPNDTGYRLMANVWNNALQPLIPQQHGLALALNSNHELDAITVGNDEKIYSSVQLAPNSTTWTTWQYLSGSVQIRGYPAIGQNQNGTLTVLVRGGDGNMYQDPQNGALAWAGWTTIHTGVLFSGDPVVARDVNGDLEAIAVGSDGQLYSSVQVSPNSTNWTSWTVVAGSFAVPGTPTLAQNQDGTLAILTRGDNGNIFENPQVSTTNMSWAGWINLQSGMMFQSNVAAMRGANGVIEALAVGSDGALYTSTQSAPNSTTWATWTAVANISNVAGSPTLAQNQNGALTIFTRGNDGSIYEDGRVVQTGITFLSDPTVATNLDGTLCVWSYGSNGNYYSSMQSGPAWSGWQKQ